MGRRGPPPKPHALKLLSGTDRKDRRSSNPLKVKPETPPRPDWLGVDVPWGEAAIEEYERVTAALAPARVLAAGDRDVVAVYADAVGRWRHFRRAAGRRGFTQTTKGGYRAPSAEAALMKQALDDMRRFGAVLGLSPSERERVSALPEPPRENAFGRISGSKLSDRDFFG
jgi:P27 family predicted phage terminase small subunit